MRTVSFVILSFIPFGLWTSEERRNWNCFDQTVCYGFDDHDQKPSMHGINDLITKGKLFHLNMLKQAKQQHEEVQCLAISND